MMGGLCNMLFITAAAEYMSYEHNVDLCYNGINEHFAYLKRHGLWVAHGEEYKTVFKNLDWFKNQQFKGQIVRTRRIGFGYEKIIPEHGTEYYGYFQSYKNFDGEFTRNLFTPSNDVLSRVNDRWVKLEKGLTCSLHVRRGNYVVLPKNHVVQGMDYYKEAISRMRTIGVDRFVVFSDDLDWCRQAFIGDEFIFVRDTDYIEMFLMSRCNHNIIGNSTFSWWGAFLGDPIGRTVIGPSRWFPHDKLDSSSIIPENWIKI